MADLKTWLREQGLKPLARLIQSYEVMFWDGGDRASASGRKKAVFRLPPQPG